MIELDQRSEDRDEHEHYSVGIDEHASDIKYDGQEDQHHLRGTGEAGSRSLNDLCHVVVGRESAEHAGEAYDQHGSGGRVDRVHEGLLEELKAQSLAEESIEQAVSAGDGAGFGSGKDTGEYSSDDDDRHHQRGESHQGILSELLPADEVFFSDIVGPGVQDIDYHVACCDDEARNEACHEQLADSDGANAGIKYHHDARGNDRAQSAAGCYQSAGITVVEAVLPHHRYEHGCKGRGISVGRTGNTCHDYAGDYGCVSKAAS